MTEDNRNEFEHIDKETKPVNGTADSRSDAVSGEYHLAGSEIPRQDKAESVGINGSAGSYSRYNRTYAGASAAQPYSSQYTTPQANSPYYGAAGGGRYNSGGYASAGADQTSGALPPHAPVYSHMFSDGSKPVKQKKKNRRISVPTVVISVLLSLAAGFGGAFLADRILPAKSGGNTVMYQSVDRQGLESGVTDLSDIVNMTQNSVVEITTESLSTNGFFGQYITSGAGSGVILSADGYIVTNNHVVSGKTNIKVTISGKEYTAKIVGTDSTSDLAVIKVDAEGLTPAVLGESSSVNVGDGVIVIGNPLGSLGGSVTDGIVSALERSITIDGKQMTLLQTNAEINPGNSGGGLFNMHGELIGIVNAKSSGTSSGASVEGIGFAIPVNTVKEVTTEIMEKGYVSGGPAMGVQIIQISTQSAAQQYGVNRLGVYIVSVDEGMGAEAAGLMPGDYIMSINDKLVETTADITNVISEMNSGDSVTLQIVRGSELLTVEVVLSERTGQ